MLIVLFGYWLPSACEYDDDYDDDDDDDEDDGADDDCDDDYDDDDDEEWWIRMTPPSPHPPIQFRFVFCL